MTQGPFQMTAHLWVAQSDLYLTNSGIFLSEGQAGLIDPGVFPGEIQAIAAFVAGRSCRPQWLVLTHSHWDHILGPEHLSGVPVVAQENYLAEVSGPYGDLTRGVIAEWESRHDIARKDPFLFPQPDVTFGETITLTVGTLSMRLVHAPGHAADQLVVYHPESATLWAADMLSDLEIPFVSHSLSAYQGTLAMLTSWEVRVLIPGHGHPTSDPEEIRARLTEDSTYLAELREKVAQCLRQGKTVEETLACCETMRYRCPEDNTGPHRLNVGSAYSELGGEADPTKYGWSQIP